MYELRKAPRYKNIWLSSKNASLNTNRTKMTFDKLPLIQIRGQRCYMRVNSIAMDSQSAGNYTGHTWTLKVENVKFNNEYYFNSDKDAIPTIACFMIDSNQMVNNGMNSLMIEEQDINNISFSIISNDSHGLTKNSQEVNMYFNIIIEEYE